MKLCTPAKRIPEKAAKHTDFVRVVGYLNVFAFTRTDIYVNYSDFRRATRMPEYVLISCGHTFSVQM